MSHHVICQLRAVQSSAALQAAADIASTMAVYRRARADEGRARADYEAGRITRRKLGEFSLERARAWEAYRADVDEGAALLAERDRRNLDREVPIE